jgi:F0F1-type ATP synthase epsilon subunit
MSASFSWSVSTPDGVAASGECEFLVVPTAGGELGVLADHAALVACVVPGELRVTASTYGVSPERVLPYSADSEGTGTRTIGVGPGVVDVRDNVVRLLVSRAAKPEP